MYISVSCHSDYNFARKKEKKIFCKRNKEVELCICRFNSSNVSNLQHKTSYVLN